MKFIQEFISKGGPFMVMNILCLAIVIGVIVERAIYFLGRGHINARAFLEQIKRLLAANNIDRAKKLCDATSAPVARVARAGLNRVHKGEAAVAQAIEETMVDVTPEVKKRIGSLWSLANIATLLGLLGTITGLIGTFAAVGSKDVLPHERQTRLSNGISEAMYNTAAVLCMIGHLILSAAAKKVVGDLEAFSLRLENMLGEGGAGGTPSASGAQHAHPAPPEDER
jgi:biopolymer transport protein ExbB/TolQ